MIPGLRLPELRPLHIRHFGSLRRNQDGGVTSLGIFSLMLVALLLGLAIDTANLYRQQTLMRLAADSAAHAGAVALARGASPAAAQQAAAGMVALNLPEERFGRLVADPATDLRLLMLDPTTGHLFLPGEDAPANAVLVRLQRSAAVNNPIPTYILRFIGFDSWTAGAVSVAAVQPTRRCSNAAGLFAKGRIEVSADSTFEGAFCLHSQQAIALPAATGIGEGVRLSLPTLEGCEDDCQGAARAGAALTEVNLQMPAAVDHVLRLAEGFVLPNMALPEKAAYFASRPLAKDLEPLAEVGLDTGGLKTGSVVSLSAFRFSQLREVPAGLVYRVTCSMPADQVSTSSLDRIRLMGIEDRAKLRNMVLVTSCPLEMDDLTRVEGALVILLHGPETVLAASPGARMGDPDRACDARKRTVLMTTGSLVLPAWLSTSNLAVVAGGDVELGSAPDAGRAMHQGLSLHVGGQLSMAGPHGFAACPEASDPVLPALRVIAHASPPLAGWVTPLLPARPTPSPEMPGKRRDALPMAGTRGEES